MEIPLEVLPEEDQVEEKLPLPEDSPALSLLPPDCFPPPADSAAEPICADFSALDPEA